MTVGITLAAVVVVLAGVGGLYYCRRSRTPDTPTPTDGTPAATPNQTPFDPTQVVMGQQNECDVESNVTVVSTPSRLRRSTVVPISNTPQGVTRFASPTKTGGGFDQIVFGELTRNVSSTPLQESACEENAELSNRSRPNEPQDCVFLSQLDESPRVLRFDQQEEAAEPRIVLSRYQVTAGEAPQEESRHQTPNQ